MGAFDDERLSAGIPVGGHLQDLDQGDACVILGSSTGLPDGIQNIPDILNGRGQGGALATTIRQTFLSYRQKPI